MRMSIEENYNLGRIIVIVGVCCIVGLIGIGCYAYFEQQTKMVTSVSVILDQALQAEKDEKIQCKVFSYDPVLSPNDILRREKEEWCDQYCLLVEDPNRSCLDSIFNAKLALAGIQGRGAISHTWKGKTVYGTSDSSFIEKSILVKTYTSRLNEEEGNEMILRGYIQFSFWWLLLHSSFPYWLGFGLLIIAVLVWGYWHWVKKGMFKKIFLVKETKAPLIQKKEMEWLELPHAMFYNKEFCILKYEDKSIKLTVDFGKLFISFMEADEYYLTHTDIYNQKSNVYSYRNDLSQNEIDTICRSVRKLRGILRVFPFIDIVPVCGTGYQLVIKKGDVD